MAFIVQRYIVIQSCIHAAGAQPVWDSPEAEYPERVGKRKSQQGSGSHRYTDGRDFSSAQFPRHPVALQTGYNGAQRNDHGYDPCIRDGNIKFRVHRRPRGTQQGVRKPEADKSQIYDRE